MGCGGSKAVPVAVADQADDAKAATSSSKPEAPAASTPPPASTSTLAIQTFLVQGDGSEVEAALKGLKKTDNGFDCLVFLSLGADHGKLAAATRALGPGFAKAVYLTETYGLVGFDPALGRNVEMIEKDRGSEYGCVGGSGGQATVVVAYSGGGAAASHDKPAPGATSCMVATAGEFAKTCESFETCFYGGVCKENFLFKPDGTWEGVPDFFVSILGGGTDTYTMGVNTVPKNSTVADAMTDIIEGLPEGQKYTGAVGLFPCFTRGINLYGKNNVETLEVESKIPEARCYGFFCFGELGPIDPCFVPPDATHQPGKQHAESTVIAVLAAKQAA